MKISDIYELKYRIYIELTLQVSKCRFIEHDYVNTTDVLMLQISREQIRLQGPPKSFRVNSWITQMIQKVNSRLFIIIIIINEFHRDASLTKTSGPVAENARVRKVLRRTRRTDSWWHLTNRRCTAVLETVSSTKQNVNNLCKKLNFKS